MYTPEYYEVLFHIKNIVFIGNGVAVVLPLLFIILIMQDKEINAHRARLEKLESIQLIGSEYATCPCRAAHALYQDRAQAKQAIQNV